MRLKDKIAIITGGANGIGKAYVNGFSREGAVVVIADTDYKAANNLAASINNKGGHAFALNTDVSAIRDTEMIAEETVKRFGRIDILVNNAAIFGRIKISREIPFNELPLDEWDKVIAVNFKGVLYCMRSVVPFMKSQGGGKIINITSGQFFTGGLGKSKYAHYIATKGAVIGLTRAAARELGEYSINVNCIAPGSTLTEESEDDEVKERRIQSPLQSRSLKRVEYPEDLIGTAVYLASSDSDFVTGQTIIVDGGGVMN